MSTTQTTKDAASGMFAQWDGQPADEHQEWWVAVTVGEFEDALEDCPDGDYETIVEIVEIVESRARTLHHEDADERLTQ